MRRCISQSRLIAIALTLAFCVFALPSFADSEGVSGSSCSGCNGYSFQASINPAGPPAPPGTFSISYTVTNVSGTAGTPYNWSLTAFDNNDQITNPSAITVTGPNGANDSSDYVAEAGKSNNGSNGNCNGNISYAICVQQTGAGTPPPLGIGQSMTFTFDVTCLGCALTNSWDFMASGKSGNGNVYGVSSWGSPTSMPEPSEWALYAATLGAVGTFVTWRSRSKSARS